MTALALALSAIERLIPLPLSLPFIKLGLANIVTLFVLSRRSTSSAAMVVCARCLLTFLLFGNVTSLAFSFAGGFSSLFVMAAMRKCPMFSVTGVSIAGAAVHCVAQVLVATIFVGSAGIASYLLVLLPFSVLSGTVIALLYEAICRTGIYSI